jgi:hypothetical protein
MRCQHCGQWNDSPNVTDQIQIASMLTNEARMAQLNFEDQRFLANNRATLNQGYSDQHSYFPNTCSSGIPQK